MGRGDTKLSRRPGERGGRVIIDQIPVVYSVNANGSLATQGVFISDDAYEVVSVDEIHSTAGTDGGAVTIDVTKETGTQAPGAGVAVLASAFNAKGAANTLQSRSAAAGTLTATQANRQLAAGDRLSIKYTGVLTALAGVQVRATLKRI